MKIKPNIPAAGKLLLFPVLLVLIVLAVVFLRDYKPQATVSAEHQPVPQKKTLSVTRSSTEVVLDSALAGRWYPADAGRLTRQVESFFAAAEAREIDSVMALILPHAGYSYSAPTAVRAIKSTKKAYKRIIIIGPSHYVSMQEMLSIPRATHYKTPLGKVAVDTGLVDALLEYPIFQNVPHAHTHEHSVQIQLPLLQYRCKDFRLVPIVAGTCSRQTIEKAAQILKGLLDDQTLVIASSDFVHYGPNYGYVPFTEDVPGQIKNLDMQAYDYIARLDCKGYLDYKNTTGATICGYVPIAILLAMLPSSAVPHLIAYTTSGDITGDFTNSVSYLSAAFSGKWPTEPKVPAKAGNRPLMRDDKNQLLTLARRAIVYFLENRKKPQPADLNVTATEAMEVPQAAFVTLQKQSRLRGCIGDIFPRQPLYESVIVNAINAAVNDRRFRPVSKDECNALTIEISILTAPEPVGSPNDIRVGTDGVVLSKDGRSAVFLPQVAPQQGWDLNQTLTQLSLKAQLPGDAWKKGAQFLTFQAVVFSEE